MAWAIFGLAAFQVLLLAFGRDQGIYGVIAEGLLRGRVPYRDLWDFKPPGIFVLYAIAQTLFGKSMVSIRLLEVAGLFSMALAFVKLSREFFGDARPGVAGAAIAAVVHAQLEFWHSGQPESFGGMLTAFALVCTAAARRELGHPRRATAWMAAVGVLFGLAFLLKPPLGGGALVCAAFLARAAHLETPTPWSALRPLIVVGSAMAMPIALCAGCFWVAGAWDALRWTMADFVPGYSAIRPDLSPLGAFYYASQEALVGFSYVIPVGVALALFMPRVHSREREGVMLIVGIVCIHVSGIAMQAKFFQYHYGATLPLLSFLAGLGFYKLWRRIKPAGLLGAAGFAAMLGVLFALRIAVRTNPGSFWSRSVDRFAFLIRRDRRALDAKLYYVADYNFGADRNAADAIAEFVKPGAPIFVWGFEPVIYWLSERPPASRYIYDVPQRTTWGRERSRRELIEDLRAHPPAAILVEHGDIFAFVTGDSLDSAGALDGFSELRTILDRDFVHARFVDKFDIYLRRTD